MPLVSEVVDLMNVMHKNGIPFTREEIMSLFTDPESLLSKCFLERVNKRLIDIHLGGYLGDA